MEEAAKSILSEEHTKQVLNELQIEWKYVGGLVSLFPAHPTNSTLNIFPT